MNYNEYKAPDGKVLFNIDNFTYGNTILSSEDLNLIVLDKEEAEELYRGYQAEQEKLREETRLAEESQKETESSMTPSAGDLMQQGDISTMSLNEDGEYEITEDSVDETHDEVDNQVEQLNTFRKDRIAELLTKGVNFNQSNVICIKKNTESV